MLTEWEGRTGRYLARNDRKPNISPPLLSMILLESLWKCLGEYSELYSCKMSCWPSVCAGPAGRVFRQRLRPLKAPSHQLAICFIPENVCGTVMCGGCVWNYHRQPRLNISPLSPFHPSSPTGKRRGRLVTNRKYPTWLPPCGFVRVWENSWKQPLVYKGFGPKFQQKQEQGFYLHLELFIPQVMELNRILITINTQRESRKSRTRSRREDCKLNFNPLSAKFV